MTRPSLRGAALAFAWSLGSMTMHGCRVGGLDTYPAMAQRPEGIRILAETRAGSLVGELLEVRSDGLLIRADSAPPIGTGAGPIVLIPSEVLPQTLRAGTDWPAGNERGRLIRIQREADRSWLRGLSRFPYGMSDSVQHRLLEIHGQSEVVRFGSAPTGPDPAMPLESLSFVDAVAHATEAFQDRSQAIRRGYRRVGPDFPGMGEHWVNPALVLSGGVDPTRPQILTYVETADGVRLTGAAFAVPLAAGEHPPDAPVGRSVWHDHGGSLDEEALILESPGSEAHHGNGPRLAMFHTWLWPENPEGPLAQNNWALPWVRVGLDVPDDVDAAVARALSLGGDGDGYYRLLLTRTAALSSARPEDAVSIHAIDAAVSRATGKVRALLARPSGPSSLTEDDALSLAAVWTSLWDELSRELDDAVWARLAPARSEWGGG